MEILEQIIEIVGQIIGFFFAYHLLRLAYKLFSKDKFAGAVFASWAAAFVLLCSLPWFQGLAKSFFTSNLTLQLTALGNRLNTVQAITADLHNQLMAHQSEIDRHQREFDEARTNILDETTNLNTIQTALMELHNQLAGHQSEIDRHRLELDGIQRNIQEAETNFLDQKSVLANQVKQISILQSEVAVAGTNLSTQELKLSEVENLVKNMFGKMTNDAIRTPVTNF
jgi:septal ring factor EnvC (AmiA/AmiB activator)